MDVIIAVHDNIVIIDGEGRTVDCSGLDPMIRIVRWDSTSNKGWLEFHNDPLGSFNRNGQLTKAADFTEFQPLVDAWNAVGPPPPLQSPPVVNPPPEQP